MQVITTLTDRANTYTTTFRSEYLSDLTNALVELEASCEYETRKHIDSYTMTTDMDAADCLYYTQVVTYYTLCEKTAAFAKRLLEIAAENEAWAAAQAAAPAPKVVVVNGVTIENADFKAPNFTCNVGKFVKHQWNNETEEDMFYWIRCNQDKFPEYARALRSILGEEAEQLTWQWQGMQDAA